MSLYLSGLEPRIIRQFIAIVEQGSFKHAAEQLHVSQAALSTSIAQLEEKLSVKLFERLPRGISPTIYGQTLYRRAKIVQAELNMAIDEIDLIRGAKKGAVVIGAGHSILSSIITELILNVSEERPDIQLMVLSGPEKMLFSAVLQGDAEFAITSCSSGPLESDLTFEHLYEMTTYPIVAKNHPLAGLSRIDWGKLRQYPWIIVDPSFEPGEQEVFSVLNQKTPKTLVKTNSPYLIKSVIGRSNFITFMPDIMIFQNETDDFVTLGSKPGIYRTPMGIITRTTSNLSPAATYVIDEIRSLYAKMEA